MWVQFPETRPDRSQHRKQAALTALLPRPAPPANRSPASHFMTDNAEKAEKLSFGLRCFPGWGLRPRPKSALACLRLSKLPLSRARARAHALTNRQARTHARTHAHTLARSLARSLSTYWLSRTHAHGRTTHARTHTHITQPHAVCSRLRLRAAALLSTAAPLLRNGSPIAPWCAVTRTGRDATRAPSSAAAPPSRAHARSRWRRPPLAAAMQQPAGRRASASFARRFSLRCSRAAAIQS